MRKGAILTFALSAAFFLALSANGQPPGEKGPPGQPGKGGFGQPGQPGKGGFGFGGRGAPGQILPVPVIERLKLTDEQKKALADLQKDVDAKLEKLMTDEQRAEFKKMKEAGPGGPGGGFPGGPGGPGGKGGFPGRGGDKGGNPPPKKD